MARYIPPHPKKGSPEAYAWAERMQVARKARARRVRQAGVKTTRQFFRKGRLKPFGGMERIGNPNPQQRGVDPTAAHELYLYAVNTQELYRQREVPIVQNLQRKWKKGTYEHARAKDLWMYWATDAAKRYAKEFSIGTDWAQIFNPATRYAVAEQRADFWKQEFELGNFMNNPGAQWHRQAASVAGRYKRSAPTSEEKHFYAGMERAHADSAGAARKLGMNPGLAYFRSRSRSVHEEAQRAGYSIFTGKGKTIKRVVLQQFKNRKGETIWLGYDHIAKLFAVETDKNPLRPHGKFRSCVRQVTRSLKQSGRKGDPKKICGATMAEAYPKKNPLVIYNGANPPDRVSVRVAGIVYNRCLEVRAEKTGFKPGLYRHPFRRNSSVQVLALDNGDLLLHSTAGEKLWRTA